MTADPYVFFHGDVPLAARIHREAGDWAERQPAVIVTGSWLTVKEQMADHYARALAARGYTAITFDFGGFGGSGGGPRQAEVPARKIADIAAVAGQVASLSFVRPGAVGYLAVCASAQYALAALAAGAPIASFASVAGWFHTSLSGGEPETLPAGDLVARWQGLLPGFDAAQHLTGPVLVSRDGGPGVRLDTHVIGYHRITDPDEGGMWAVHGHYTARLVDGVITELTLTVFFQDGRLDLPDVATRRAAAGRGRARR